MKIKLRASRSDFFINHRNGKFGKQKVYVIIGTGF
jgi:hypothetical protein